MESNNVSKPFFFPTKLVVVLTAYILTGFIIAAAWFVKPSEFNTFQPLRLLIIIFASTLLAKYFFYMTISPLESLRSFYSKKYWKKKRPLYYPRVSVIVPAWNEEVGIIATIDSLLASSYEKLEVIVVNDGSTDGSDELIRAYSTEIRKKLKITGSYKKIRYRYQKNAGKGAALNKAIKVASGDIIISIDADCLVDKNAISAFVQHFRNPKVMGAVGNVKIGNTSTLLGTIQSLEFLFSFYFKKCDSFLNTIYIVGGAAGAFRKEVFEQIGIYNTTNITEDIELSMRMQNAGMRIVYASDAIVHTEGASDMKGLKSQRLRWKRGRFETFWNYVHMFFSRKTHHNKLLSFLVLPLAMFAELQLLFEIPFVVFLYFYSFVATDFSSFISGIIVVSSMFFFLMVFEDKSTRRFSFYILAPVGWCLFYVMTYVEASALIRSIVGLFKGERLHWQRWERQGLQN